MAGIFGSRDGGVPVREGLFFFDAHLRILKSRAYVEKEQTFTGTNALSPHYINSLFLLIAYSTVLYCTVQYSTLLE